MQTEHRHGSHIAGSRPLFKTRAKTFAKASPEGAMAAEPTAWMIMIDLLGSSA